MIARPIARARLVEAALLFALVWPVRAAAQYTEAPAPAAYALTGVTVVQADGHRAEGMTVVIRGGLVEAIGAEVVPPADARVLEGDSLVVYPGFVDAQGDAKFEFPETEFDRSQIKSWDPPREYQGFQPHRRVVDVLEATGEDLKAQRMKGVAVAAVHPEGTLMPGRGTLLVLRKGAKTPRELVHTPVLGPDFTLRGGRGAYPATLFGVLAFYRQSFEDAARLRTIAAEYASDPHGLPAPSYDPDYAVLQEVMGGGTPVYFAVDGAEDIRRVLDLAAQYRLRPVILGGGEAWKVADRLKAENVPVLVSLDFGKPRRWKPAKPGAETDSAATGEQELDPAVFREKKEFEDRYANAGRLVAAGVRIALTSGGGKADLIEGARKAIEYGLPETAALRALTAGPAELFGVPQMTRIAAGYPANLVVTDGALFGKGTKIVYTFVEGALEEGGHEDKAGGTDEAPAVDLTGSWNADLTSAQGGMTATITLKQDGASFSGTLSGPDIGEQRIQGGKVSGRRITFTVVVDTGGEVMEMHFSGTASGDELSGNGSGPFGEVEIKARRTSGPGGIGR